MKLVDLLAIIKAQATDVSFADPVSKKAIKQLSDEIQGKVSISLPHDLRVWFMCHNGQNCFEPSLPGNRRLLGVKEAIEAWHFFLNPNSEFLRPFSQVWFPIQSNERGDYLIYDLKSGNLIGYWHDDPDRQVEFESLQNWAEFTRNSLLARNVHSLKPIERVSPDSLKITIELKPGVRNLSLAKEIHSIAAFPLTEVVRFLEQDESASFLEWDLTVVQGSLERARQVRIAKQVACRIIAEGISVALKVESGHDSDVVSPDDLDALSLRCLTD